MIDELRRRGLRVPEDLSVMGGGGEEVPGLTCHQADWHGMGRYAVQVLVRALSEPGQHVPEHHLNPHVLRPGRTTAPPAAGRDPLSRVTCSAWRLAGPLPVLFTLTAAGGQTHRRSAIPSAAGG